MKLIQSLCLIILALLVITSCNLQKDAEDYISEADKFLAAGRIDEAEAILKDGLYSLADLPEYKLENLAYKLVSLYEKTNERDKLSNFLQFGALEDGMVSIIAYDVANDLLDEENWEDSASFFLLAAEKQHKSFLDAARDEEVPPSSVCARLFYFDYMQSAATAAFNAKRWQWVHSIYQQMVSKFKNCEAIDNHFYHYSRASYVERLRPVENLLEMIPEQHFN